jgi:uncharacterized membrane protein YozB (DUF420 family)
MDHRGLDGFLPWRGSLMLDVVFLAMFLVIPVMAWSIRQAKAGRYALHKRVQLGLGVVLLVAVTCFELDMQLFTDWRVRAAGWDERPGSPYYDPVSDSGIVVYALWVHLVFAVSTAVLWIYVIVQGVRKFPSPPQPGPYSPTHVRWARIAAWDMFLTALTGWMSYYLAFIAT